MTNTTLLGCDSPNLFQAGGPSENGTEIESSGWKRKIIDFFCLSNPQTTMRSSWTVRWRWHRRWPSRLRASPGTTDGAHFSATVFRIKPSKRKRKHSTKIMFHNNYQVNQNQSRPKNFNFTSQPWSNYNDDLVLFTRLHWFVDREQSLERLEYQRPDWPREEPGERLQREKGNCWLYFKAKK